MPGLYQTEPPPLRTRQQDNPTLLVSWWCTGFALTIILFRLAGRIIRTERLFREDKIMALAIIPLFARMALIQVVLRWGTNNTVTTGLDPVAVRHREVGSGLVLAARIMYAAILWIEKFTITEFFKRITVQFWKRSYELGITILRWFLFATFIAVVISTLAECRPFSHYYQVIPDPGPQCRQAYVQLITMGAADVLTDLLLVAFPVPIILRSAMKKMRKFELILLFALSIIPIAVTLYRIPSIISYRGRQQYRSLWASIEILFATAVTNALVLGSFVRDRGPKKMRFKFGSASDSLSRPSTRRDIGRTEAYWGSDEDLVHGLGLNLGPELRGSEKVMRPRPAPIATPAPVASREEPMPPVDLTQADWHFPSEEKVDPCRRPSTTPADRSPGEVAVLTPRKVSFFDVGGLLDEASSPRPSASTAYTSDRKQSIQSSEFSGPDRWRFSSRQGSNALLHDMGGVIPEAGSQAYDEEMSSSPLADDGPPSDSRAIIAALQTPPPATQLSNESRSRLARSGTVQSLQDVGGLLRLAPSPVQPPAAADASAHNARYSMHGADVTQEQPFQDVGGLLGGGTSSRDLVPQPSAQSLAPASVEAGYQQRDGFQPSNIERGAESPGAVARNFSQRDVTTQPQQYQAPW